MEKPMRAIVLILALPLLLAACPTPQPPVKQVSAGGVVLGSLFDGTPLTVGKGDLAGKGLVVNYFGVG
jgi:hypothetical protein